MKCPLGISMLASCAAVGIMLASSSPALAQFRLPHISPPHIQAPQPRPTMTPSHPRGGGGGGGGFGLTGPTGANVASNATNYQNPNQWRPNQPSTTGGYGLTGPTGANVVSNATNYQNPGQGLFNQPPMSFSGNGYYYPQGGAGFLPGPGYIPQQPYYQPQQQVNYQQPQPGYYQQPQQDVAYPQGGGQRFQIPQGYEGYAAGSVINYGGMAYTAAGDGTMTTYSRGYQGVTAPSGGQRYQVPPGYEGSVAGSVINYGGASYVIAGDGTMTTSTGIAGAPATTPAMASADAGASANTQARASSPVSGQRYRVPAKYAGTAAGSVITYAGYKYLINNDATMTAMSDTEQGAAQGRQDPAKPIPGKRYRIPAESASTAPGAVISYGDFKYLANNDGTMTAFSDQGSNP
jgi:hypothetical protein